MKLCQELFLHFSLLAMTISMRLGTVTATELKIQEILSPMGHVCPDTSSPYRKKLEEASNNQYYNQNAFLKKV